MSEVKPEVKPEEKVVVETEKPKKKEVIMPESDKTYHMGQRFRQFVDVKGFKFNSVGGIWQITWVGSKEAYYTIQFCKIGTDHKFDLTSSIAISTKIPAGAIAMMTGFDSVDKFEKHFKPID